MTQAIASFERTPEVSPFDSKYDRYLRGEYDLTPTEDLGKSIFFSNNNNSLCFLSRVKKVKIKRVRHLQIMNIIILEHLQIMF